MKLTTLALSIALLIVNAEAISKYAIARPLSLSSSTKRCLIIGKTRCHHDQYQPPEASKTLALKLRGGHVASGFVDYISKSSATCWLVLILSILVDTGSTTLLKIGRDSASMAKIFMAYCGFFLSLSGFAISLASIDVSIAYAVWAALGTAVVSAIGILLFNESYGLPKVLCLVMIVLGVVGLNLLDEH